MSEPARADALARDERWSEGAVAARIGFMGGWPTAYVLEKIGRELRQVYMAFVREPLPGHLLRLAAKLEP